MAAHVMTAIDIDRKLDQIDDDVEAMDQVLTEWASLPDVERLVWTAQWERLLGVIASLDDSAITSRMSSGQRQRLADQQARAASLTPRLHACGLATSRRTT